MMSTTNNSTFYSDTFNFFRYLTEAAKIMKSPIETTVLHFVFVKSRNEKTM